MFPNHFKLIAWLLKFVNYYLSIFFPGSLLEEKTSAGSLYGQIHPCIHPSIHPSINACIHMYKIFQTLIYLKFNLNFSHLYNTSLKILLPFPQSKNPKWFQRDIFFFLLFRLRNFLFDVCNLFLYIALNSNVLFGAKSSGCLQSLLIPAQCKLIYSKF